MKRKLQTDIVRKLFSEYQQRLATTESWLASIAVNAPKGISFDKCGVSICDIIIMNRFPLVFGEDIGIHDAAMKAFLLSHGVPVAYIKNTAKKGDTRASIKLDDAANEFNVLLLLSLDVSLQKLRERVREAAANKKLTQRQLQKELDRVHIA